MPKTLVKQSRSARTTVIAKVPGPGRDALRALLIVVGLIVITLIAFYPVVRCGFINFDDEGYLTGNAIVQQGLTLNGIIWAFTHTPMNLWHPLSFLSLMVDVELLGLDPAGFHAVNLLFHLASVGILFACLWRMTGKLWPSALVAALFAIHPLRVESVAWVAERKDVLAIFFGLLALFVYVGYARKPAIWRYGLAAIMFTLSLLAKPMLLPLPVMLLLLDYWPLKRTSHVGSASRTDSLAPQKTVCDAGPAKSAAPVPRRDWIRLAIEKIPLLLICIVIVLIGQHMAEKTPPRKSDAYQQTTAQRHDNAVVSYVIYMVKMVRVDDLAIFYPIRPRAGWQVAAAGGVLLGITILAIGFAKSRPWLIVGWLWFLIGLAPVIGIGPQIGFHAMADRYTYFPSIGLLIALIWSIPSRWLIQPRAKLAAGVVTALVLVTLCLFTHRQITYWQNSVTLFEHDLAVAGDNDFAQYSLGCAYWLERHDAAQSIAHFESALKLRPDLASAHNNLGLVLTAQNHPAAAIEHFRASAEIDPTAFETYDNWGCALFRMGDYTGAETQFRRSLQLNPQYYPATVNLSMTLAAMAKKRGSHESLN